MVIVIVTGTTKRKKMIRHGEKLKYIERIRLGQSMWSIRENLDLDPSSHSSSVIAVLCNPGHTIYLSVCLLINKMKIF